MLLRVFLSFAAANFVSAALRAVMATLAPTMSLTMGLTAADLGLLAGVHFLGFALAQLPLGAALDRRGPKPVLLALLTVAVLGCVGFSQARDFQELLLARLFIGLGVSGCLMAGLTAFSRMLVPASQLRANAWMLMTGSLGMLASTLPVQWLLPSLGWRGLFLGFGGLLLLAMAAVAMWVPAHLPTPDVQRATPPPSRKDGYAEVFRHPAFRRLAWVGFFGYGGLLAMQSLWIGPWLTQIHGATAAASAAGLFLVNLTMLLVFWCWGALMPLLVRRGWHGERLVAAGWPVGLLVLVWILWLGPQATAWHWALWCASCSVITQSQMAVAQAFSPAWAGRALSAFNLVIFAGVFALQWGIGLMVDLGLALGWSTLAAYRASFGVFAMCSVVLAARLQWSRRRLALAGELPR